MCVGLFINVVLLTGSLVLTGACRTLGDPSHLAHTILRDSEDLTGVWGWYSRGYGSNGVKPTKITAAWPRFECGASLGFVKCAVYCIAPGRGLDPSALSLGAFLHSPTSPPEQSLIAARGGIIATMASTAAVIRRSAHAPGIACRRHFLHFLKRCGPAIFDLASHSHTS